VKAVGDALRRGSGSFHNLAQTRGGGGHAYGEGLKGGGVPISYVQLSAGGGRGGGCLYRTRDGYSGADSVVGLPQGVLGGGAFSTRYMLSTPTAGGNSGDQPLFSLRGFLCLGEGGGWPAVNTQQHRNCL
jgi:hypothetical protein